MTDASTVPAPAVAGSLVESLDRELEGLARELAEIDLLLGQARTEAARHEQKRAATAERIAGLGTGGPAAELAETNAQLVTLTRKAAVMDAQLDVLAGKARTLGRYRDGLARVRDAVAGLPAGAIGPGSYAASSDQGMPAESPTPVTGAEEADATTTGTRRLVLAAQEDLRRDIAKAIHDGPAQSLTNIVLQAQIVDRLLERDPAAARDEVRELVAMVQRTLEATKTFIFDVRPMVLDDLGLVPTLRRVARERSRRAATPVEFDSVGADRRLPMELEGAVFRVADEAVAGLLGGKPQLVAMTVEWGADELVLGVRGVHPAMEPAVVEEPRADMPAALRAMVDERRAVAAAGASVAVLTPAIRRGIEDRAAAAGGLVTVAEDGRSVSVRFSIPAPPPSPESA